MPIVSSEIIENSVQANGRRHITEEHTDSNGKKYHVSYLSRVDQDVDQELLDRVPRLNTNLIEFELDLYINMIKKGDDLWSYNWVDTSTAERALKMLDWVQECINVKDYQSLRYTPTIIDQYTAEQIDQLIGESGKGSEIKTMVEKIRNMNAAIEGLEV